MFSVPLKAPVIGLFNPAPPEAGQNDESKKTIFSHRKTPMNTDKTIILNRCSSVAINSGFFFSNPSMSPHHHQDGFVSQTHSPGSHAQHHDPVTRTGVAPIHHSKPEPGVPPLQPARPEWLRSPNPSVKRSGLHHGPHTALAGPWPRSPYWLRPANSTRGPNSPPPTRANHPSIRWILQHPRRFSHHRLQHSDFIPNHCNIRHRTVENHNIVFCR